MRVTLIEPPRFYAPASPISTVVIPPLGLAYVAAALEGAGHRVHVVDALISGADTYSPFADGVHARGMPAEDILDAIPPDSELIGLSCMFSAQWLVVRELAKAVKTRFPGIPLILGGEHGTGLPELSMCQAPLDYIVLGEGEETAVELADRLAAGSPAKDILGAAARLPDGSFRVNSRRPRILNIDRLRPPAWHLFDIEAYIEFNQPHGASRGRFIPMLATRGCPFQCTFCTSPQMWTQRWVARNPVRVVDEIEDSVRRFHVTDIHFEDLTAIVRKDWIVDFCKEVVRRNLRITFQLPSGTRSEAVDAETAAWMKKAGCHELSFAPESGDARVLKAVKKQVRLPRLFDSAKAAMDAGINVGGFFIVGFPEDDWPSILNTFRVIAKCAWIGFSSVNVNPYSPQPNTASFRRLREDGILGEIDDDYLLDLFRFQDLMAAKVSYNKRFGPRQIKCFVLAGFAVFYAIYFLSRPWRILRTAGDILVRRSSSDKSARALSSLLRDFGRARRNHPVRRAAALH